MRRRLTQRHPSLLPLAVGIYQLRRRLAWATSGNRWAAQRPQTGCVARAAQFPIRAKEHASLLLRDLAPAEMALQHSKVVNLRRASARTDGVVIAPGETFSFNRVLGNCTARKRYVVGMRLSDGEPSAGVGGGICQLANLMHWMFLHSPLSVVERSEHSFDPFPDQNRVLPWGVGCSIVWNYVDLVVRNDTDTTFEVTTWVETHHLRGELRADRPLTESYRIAARAEQFLRVGDRVWRRNEIWRTVIDRRTGEAVGEELIKRNCAVVCYSPPEHLVIDLDQHGIAISSSQAPTNQATTTPASITRAGLASTVTSVRGSAS